MHHARIDDQQARLAVVDDLGHSLEQVELSYFEENVLLPLPEGLDVAMVVAKLKCLKVICGGRWRAYSTNPKDSDTSEDSTFSCLVIVTNAILSAAKETFPGAEPRIEYRNRPKNEIFTVYETIPSQPDGYFVLSDCPIRSDERLHWFEVAVPAEYKLFDTDSECLDVGVSLSWILPSCST